MIKATCKGPVAGSILFGSLKWTGDSLATVRDKRVSIDVHGFKNTDSQAAEAYREFSVRAGDIYGQTVGFFWPSGATPAAWPLVSIGHTHLAARYLQQVIEAVCKNGATHITVNAHSIGAQVALGAIWDTPYHRLPYVDHLVLLAPGCDRDLSKYRNIALRDGIDVFYSKKDPVLSLRTIWPRFDWPPFEPALGQWGEKSKYGNIARNHDMTNEVGASHNGYRHVSALYQTLTNVYHGVPA